MALRFLGESFLNSLLGLLSDKLISSPVVVNWIQRKKLNRKLVERLETTLYAARAVLNDAEKRQIKEKAVKDWLDSLKDAVYKADDLLDEVSTKAATQKEPGNLLSRFLNSQDREIVHRMEDITDTIESIVRQKDILGLKEIPKENFLWRTTTSLVEISYIHGRDEDKKAIKKLLLDDTADGKISVIPIVGMGAIGKTALAQMVYQDNEVEQNFDFQAWVCVSEEFDVIKITRTIIEAITSSSCNKKDLNLLQHDLKEKLSRGKFLVVLDDAWTAKYEDWYMLLKPFYNGVKGSKILVTTRSSEVASVVQTVRPHELTILSDEDSWLVFAKHAFLSLDSTKNPTLEKIGRDIVKKCNGLPLAAQTLGGLLRENYDERYWNQILKSEIWELPEDKSMIIPALRISYYYLPSCLKECFIYCSLYPKDYEFDKHELILLWKAENFLKAMGEKTLEEVGYEYFDELVSRSFFQPQRIKKNVFLMHDFMHDLAISYSREFYFRAEKVESTLTINNKTRHLSHNAKGDYPISELMAACDRITHARTFLEINLGRHIPFSKEKVHCVLLSHLKCLRVLSFKFFPLDSLPDSIGELIHLRYLDLSDTRIVVLPNSLNNLYNLQTMKLKNCSMLKRLPSDMQNLVNLRHLDARGSCLEEMPKGISKLKYLQFLSNFVVGKHEENGIGELEELASLHDSLSITKLENVIDSDQASMAKMGDKKYINDLELSWSPEGDVSDPQIEIDILHELRPHVGLEKLKISCYRGTRFPNWLGNPSYHNMTELKLKRCRTCSMLPSLGQLPSLKHLKISYFDGLEIVGAEFYKNDESSLETPFPSLETLEFKRMPSWKEWHSSEFNAFPKLKELMIRLCPVLTGELPNQLPALGALHIISCYQLNSSLPRAPAIRNLYIRGENRVRMGELPLSVKVLEIAGSQLVEPVLEAVTHRKFDCLRSLRINECSSAISIPVACLPASLIYLMIENCTKLEFQLQQQHESLQSLDIYSCNSLTSFSLDTFPNLKRLRIHHCSNFVSFSTPGMLAPQLEHFLARRCPKFDPFPSGVPQANLRYLCISHSEKLMSYLASMNSHSHRLTSLVIEGEYDRMTSFPKEGLLPATLESLVLWHFPSLETLECKGLVHLTSLQQLRIWNCPELKNVAGERLPTSLIRLDVKTSRLLGKLCEVKDPQIWPKISHVRCIEVDDKWIW